MPAHELAPENALRPDRGVPRADVQPRAPDDDLALLDDHLLFRRDPHAVNASAVARPKVAHTDPAVLQQRQQRMLWRDVFVVQDDVAAQITADAACGAGALDAQLQDRLPMRTDLLDQHHGVHCRAPR